MSKSIAIFSGITVNGHDFSDVETIRFYARTWSALADCRNDEALFQIADSLFDLLDEIEGVTSALVDALDDIGVDPEDPEYSDIYKEIYGFRP